MMTILTSSLLGQNSIERGSADKNWRYIVISDTQTVKVIEYFNAPFHCGTLSVASMAICLDMNNDSLRIFERCPDPAKRFKTGQTLIFYPYKYITAKNIDKYRATDDFANHKYNSVVPTSFGDLKSK